MLTRIHVRNYKCLLDVSVNLGAFTVLIGPNDSGKTSVLEVVQDLAHIAKEPLQNVYKGDRSLSNLVWRKDPARAVFFKVSGSTDRGEFTYQIELAPERKPTESLEFNGKTLDHFKNDQGSRSPTFGPSEYTALARLSQPSYQQHPTFADVAEPARLVSEALAATVEYRFDLDKLRASSIPEPDPTLHATGDNLASVLDSLLGSPDRSAFAQLEKALHNAVPTLEGIALRAVRDRPGAKAVEFALSGNGQSTITIPANLVSSGALLLTAFLALSYTDTPGILLIEEPENGLHPSRLETVINILRKLTTGEVGNRKRQVIVTTHSPLLLNYLRPEEVRIFVADSERGTQVTPMAQVPDIDRLLKEFAVGELWYLLGEEKLVGGKPA